MIKNLCFAALALACLTLQGCGALLPLALGTDRGKVSIEVVEPAERFWTTDEVLIIPLSGTVDVGDTHATRGEPGMLVGLKDRLKEAELNSRIKAVVLRIDTPGGSVTAADLIYREILAFKKKKEIPVIAEMMDVAASGGFYIAMAADEVYALPTTLTGSIGVIMMMPGLTGLMGKIGVDMRVVKSGPNKDIGSMWRDMTPEERKIIQDLIDKYYRIFMNVVLEGRRKAGLTEVQLKPLADGRVLDAETAKNAGLIDGIMYPEDAIKQAMKKAGIKDARIVTYEYPYSYRGNIYARNAVPEPQAGTGDMNLLKIDAESLAGIGKKPQFMYYWLP